MESACIVEVIRVEHTKGKGTCEDPVRTEVTYWSKDGRLITRIDINDDPYFLPRP